jgi:hypothetical protein
MGMLATPNMGLPYPDDNELLQDVPDFVRVLALALDKGKIPSFATAAARTTGIPAPSAGSICWMTDVPVRLVVYDGSTWQRVYPTVPIVTSGSATPTGTAEAGAIYVQY